MAHERDGDDYPQEHDKLMEIRQAAGGRQAFVVILMTPRRERIDPSRGKDPDKSKDVLVPSRACSQIMRISCTQDAVLSEIMPCALDRVCLISG